MKREFITLGELRKMFHLFSNSIIDCEIFSQDEMNFEKSFKILFKELITIMLRTRTI
jgi:hypothetical protein